MSGQNWLRGRTIVYSPVPQATVKPTKRFRVGRILWEALKRTAMLFGFIMLISIVIGAWSASQMLKQTTAPSLPKKMVLLLDTSGQVISTNPSLRYLEEFGLGGSAALSVPAMVDAIDTGAKDKRVEALSLFLSSASYDVTDYQELRAAIMRFKATGKPIRAYADSFGGNGSGMGQYYLASTADEIWMQPVGVVAIPGMSAEVPFVRALLERFGIKPEFFQRKEYKTAMETFSATGMSPESRQQMEGMIKDIGDQFTRAIATDRTKVSKTFRALVDQGLFTDEEALRLGLIDHIGYRDVFVAEFRNKIGGNATNKTPEFVSLEQYASVPQAKVKGPTVARITISGMITEGGEGSIYELNQQVASSETIANAILMAAEDTSIKAILLRIDSPGGTPTAAETIHRAIKRAQVEYKKPVIVSMSNLAASGGYWIAAPADKIYALPGTLTGSIGVVGGKADLSGLWQKLDVNWEEVPYAQNSGMWSMNHGFTDSQQERFENTLDNVYDYFVKRVGEGRKLSPERVEAIAKGHVWTGRQAKELGLVDVLGGEDKALDDLALKLGASSRMNLSVVNVPKPETKLEALMSLLSMQASLPAFLPKSVMQQISPYLIETDGRMIYQPLPQLKP